MGIFDKPDERITINSKGIIVGSGGNIYGKQVSVEDNNGVKIGTTTKEAVEYARKNRTPLEYTKL
jgi:hypothetical protein